MRNRICLICLLAGLMLLCACRAPASPSATPSLAPLPGAPLTMLSFSESSSYFKRVQDYEFRAEEGRYTVYFSMANEEEPYPVPVDQAWVDTLTGFIAEYGMIGWDGFSGSATDLLDGTHFFVSFTFADGTGVQASGYGLFPNGYRGASEAIDAHFMQLLPEDMRDW